MLAIQLDHGDFWVFVFVSTGVLVFRRFACYAVWTPGRKVSMSEFIQLATFVGRGIWCTQASWLNTWFCMCLFSIASMRVRVQGGSVAWGRAVSFAQLVVDHDVLGGNLHGGYTAARRTELGCMKLNGFRRTFVQNQTNVGVSWCYCSLMNFLASGLLR